MDPKSWAENFTKQYDFNSNGISVMVNAIVTAIISIVMIRVFKRRKELIESLADKESLLDVWKCSDRYDNNKGQPVLALLTLRKREVNTNRMTTNKGVTLKGESIMIITAIVLWVVALAFILVTLKNILMRAVKTRHCTATTRGVISDVKEKVIRRDGIISKEYIPTMNYTVDGFEYSRKFTKAYHAGTYAIGQTVEIMYNPDKPSEINTRASLKTSCNIRPNMI